MNLRVLPASAEGFDELDGRNQPEFAHLRREFFVFEHGAFGVNHLKVVREAFLVARCRNISSFLRGGNCVVLGGFLLLQYPQTRKSVLHFLERCQNLFAVIRNRFIVRRLRPDIVCAQAPAP